MKRGFRIRIYPNKEQEVQCIDYCSAFRYIYNYMLEYQFLNHKFGGKYLRPYNMYNLLTKIRQDSPWLNSINVATLRGACDDLHLAFRWYFEKVANLPKFKSKKYGKQIFAVRTDRTRFISVNTIRISGIGNVRYKTNYNFTNFCGKLFNPRVSKVGNKWFLTFTIGYDSQVANGKKDSMGIDLGIKTLAVVSHNNEIIKFHNINKSKKMRNLERRIKHTQREIARKQLDSKNRLKARKIYQRLCRKQSNIRLNYTHQITRQLVNRKPERVVMEKLNVMGMMKNKYLAHAVIGQNFYEFRRQMQYKCEWAGIEFVLADRFYPSSKTCSNCGNIKHSLRLKDRTYICDKCGSILDRDENAAINLQRYVV